MDYNMDQGMYAQSYSQPSMADNPVFMLFVLVWLILVVVAYWKVFQKAGKPGWAAIVPFYNIWVLLEVVNKPTWWIIWFFIPIANIVVPLIVGIELAKKFGQSMAFGIFLNWLFHPIGQLILGFGKAKYKK